MTTETIDQKTLVQLVEAGAVHAARVIGCGNGWAVSARCGASERLLAAKHGDVRVFRRFETLVGFLREIGISRFDVDASDFDPDAAGRATRPDRAAALKAAHEAAVHDRWFREQVQQALDDPRPSIPDAEVSAEFASRRAALRQRIAGKRGNAA